MELVATGQPEDLLNIRTYDELIPEGSRGMLQLNTVVNTPQWAIDRINDGIKAAKIPNAYVKADGKKMKIYFKKEFPWLPVIVGVIIPLLVILAIVILTWMLYKESPVVAAGALILGIAAASFVGMKLLKRVL